jgi:hypothetical protein
LARKLKPRPTFRQHTQSDYDKHIAAAYAPNTILFDMAVEESMVENFGTNEYDRGVIEGARRYNMRLINIALNFGKEGN